MKEDTFDQVAASLVHFSNELEHEVERSIVFSIEQDEPKYFRFYAYQGNLDFLDKPPKSLVIIESLEIINIDQFLDEVLEGNQIIKDNNIKRFIASYEFI